jgi:cytochrome c-type biogenesis protein CcmH
MKPAPLTLWMTVVLVAVSLALTASTTAVGQPGSREELSARPPAPGERGLEARLLAPCCYQGTLDAHESELAHALRMEIRSRLYAGETVEAVEQSLVQQYGERIRARPAHDPWSVVVAALLAASALAGLGVARVLRRWQRATTPEPTPELTPAALDAYDARLDAELAEME